MSRQRAATEQRSRRTVLDRMRTHLRSDSVEVTRDANVVSGRRQNVGKPTALEQPVSSGMIERCISIGDLLATAECENRSGSNKWSAAHRPKYNSTKPRFAYFGCSSGETLDKTKISIRFCGHRSWLLANSFYVNCNGYRGRRHRVGVMWILLAFWKEVPHARGHSASFR